MAGRIYKDTNTGAVKSEKTPDYYKLEKDGNGNITLTPKHYGQTGKDG